MEKKIDCELQLRVLQLCREAYPNRAADENLPCHPHLQANLIYLYELELIYGTLVNGNVELMGPQITAKGLDFLEDDGGISAMLRAVTVKIDRDDLRALIAARIESSDLPTDKKASLSHAMRSLPAQALGELTKRLVNEAVGQWPGALQLFQTYAGPS